MPSSTRSSLPHRARGLALGPAALILARDKLVLSAGDGRAHLTVHFGPHSRVIELHETVTESDGSKTHKRLFTITHANLELLVREIAPGFLKVMSDLLNPLRVGWMARRQVAVVVGLIPDDADIEKVTSVRRGKLIVDPDKLATHASVPEFLEELYDLRDGTSFALFDCRKPGGSRLLGIGFKYTDSVAQPHLTWFRRSAMADAMKRLTSQFHEAAARYGQFHEPLPWSVLGSPPNAAQRDTAKPYE